MLRNQGCQLKVKKIIHLATLLKIFPRARFLKGVFLKLSVDTTYVTGLSQIFFSYSWKNDKKCTGKNLESAHNSVKSFLHLAFPFLTSIFRRKMVIFEQLHLVDTIQTLQTINRKVFASYGNFLEENPQLNGHFLHRTICS